MPRLLTIALLLLSVAAIVAQRVRFGLFQLGTQSQTVPCASPTAAKLVYQPVGSGASINIVPGGIAVGEGTTVAGDYVVACNATAEHQILTALNHSRPVINTGQQVVFEDTFQSSSITDSDTQFQVWESVEADDNCKVNHSAISGLTIAGPGCGIQQVAVRGNTIGLFRHDMTITASELRLAGMNASARFGLTVAPPSTRWSPQQHFLKPVAPGGAMHESSSEVASSALYIGLGLWVDITETSALIGVQRTSTLPIRVLGSVDLPPGCVSASAAATLQLTTSTFLVDATVVCSSLAKSKSVHIGTANHSLDWQDLDGFGSSMGEAVLFTQLAEGPAGSYPIMNIGKISVFNTLNFPVAPAVLGPITDQAATFSVDIGDMGTWHDSDQGRPTLWSSSQDGLLDVTKQPFNADNTGNEDVTIALQAAIDFARFNYMAVWMPAGVYKVSDSLRAIQQPRMTADGTPAFNSSSNYCWSRFLTTTIRGQPVRADSDGIGTTWPRPGRTTILVPPNTPAFAGGKTNTPLAVLNVSNVNARHHLQSNTLMSSVVTSIDVVVGAGNPAAVGFRLRGAQGSSLEDVAAYNENGDAFAGVQGCSGSGGAHSNVTAIGFKFGVDCRESQPAPTLSNVRLMNQTCSGLLHAGLETLTVAGLHAVGGPSTSGPAILGGASDDMHLGLPLECASALAPSANPQKSDPWQSGSLSLVDAVIEGSFTVAVHNLARSLYLKNVFISGSGTNAILVDNVTTAPLASYSLSSPQGSQWLQITELAVGVAFSGTVSPCPTIPMAQNTWIDGKESSGLLPPTVANFTVLGALPAGMDVTALVDRHGWGSNELYPNPSTDRNAIINGADHGLVGDGVSENRAVFETIVSTLLTPGSVLFLPRGIYRTTGTVVMPPGVTLAGQARQLTTIVSDDLIMNYPHSGPPYPRPIDQTAPPTVMMTSALPSPDNMTSRPLIAAVYGLTIVVPVSQSNATAMQFSLFQPSASNPAPLASFVNVRQFWATHVPMCGSWFFNSRCADRFFNANPYNHPFVSVVTPSPWQAEEAAVAAGIDTNQVEMRWHVWYQEDGHRNGGPAHVAALYQKMLVANTGAIPIRFYQLNSEHCTCEAESTFQNVGNVEVFGAKSEFSATVIKLINSTGFISYGHGGLANSGNPNAPEQWPGEGPPALYRAVDSSGFSFINLMSQAAHCNFKIAQSLMFDEPGSGSVNVSLPQLQWPVLYRRNGAV